MAEKKKVYIIKLSRTGIFWGIIFVIFSLLWMFILGIFVGQELIYFPPLFHIKSSESFPPSPKQIVKEIKAKKISQQTYGIQVGSFRKKENALTFEEKLKKQGYKTFLKTVKINNVTYYRVYVGPYSLKQILSIHTNLISQKYSPTKPIPLP